MWLDRKDATSGPIKEQIDRAIDLNNVVLVVLSESSLESDWVKSELKRARKKEKDKDHHVKCNLRVMDLDRLGQRKRREQKCG